jgi:hypothetical protein
MFRLFLLWVQIFSSKFFFQKSSIFLIIDYLNGEALPFFNNGASQAMSAARLPSPSFFWGGGGQDHKFAPICNTHQSQDSILSIVTCYGGHDPRKEISLLLMSIPAVRPTQLTVKWVLRALYP